MEPPQGSQRSPGPPYGHRTTEKADASRGKGTDLQPSLRNKGGLRSPYDSLRGPPARQIFPAQTSSGRNSTYLNHPINLTHHLYTRKKLQGQGDHPAHPMTSPRGVIRQLELMTNKDQCYLWQGLKGVPLSHIHSSPPITASSFDPPTTTNPQSVTGWTASHWSDQRTQRL